MSKHMVPAHDDIRKLVEVIHYEDHESRTESAEFKRVKQHFHETGAKCWIDNGYCEGQIEIHHNVIEYSAATEVDWEKVKAVHGFDHVDDEKQMLPLCEKHHRGIGTGIHMITYPAWQLQKYIKPDALAKFEAAVEHLIELGHDEHTINHHAKKMLLHVAKTKE